MDEFSKTDLNKPSPDGGQEQLSSPRRLPPSALPAASALKKQWFAWGHLFTQAILAIYFYVFIEWIFDVTKPSFMDPMPFGTKLGILLLSGLVLVVVSLPWLLLLFVASRLSWWSGRWKIFLSIAGFLPGFFLAATALTMVDNFTYTLFKFGIVSTNGILRGIYGLIFLFLLIGSTRWVIRLLSDQTRKRRSSSTLKAQTFACAGILALSIPFGASLYSSPQTADVIIPDTGSAVRRPHILMIGTDGLNADLLSLYGYKRSNTPFLDSFARGALLAENNFTNANMTTGSHVSMLTGKPPTETRTLYPPDILRGDDAFQHLPGILKKEGYYNAQISVDYYGDADAVNLRDGFVSVNGRSAAASGVYTFARRYIPEDTAFFLSMLAKRFSDRIFHIYYLRSMSNPYAQVTQKMDNSSDQERVKQLLSLFRNIQAPLFAHVYMMGTHIGMYDEYDDAVREFDSYVRQVVEELDRLGKLEQTLIVVYTDHGKSNARNIRTPLIIRFPKQEYVGKISHNTQNLDIPPTILDYLGIQPPVWMDGHSLLRGEPPASRPIFSAAPRYLKPDQVNRWQLSVDPSKIKPPFYQFGIIDLVICHRWYSVDTSHLIWEEGRVQGYPNPCSPDDIPSRRQAQQILLDHLEQNGFDVTTLEAALNTSSSR